MKIRILFYSLLTFLVMGCNNEDGTPGEEILSSQHSVMLRSGAKNTTVLFFQKVNNVYSYTKTASVDVRTTVGLNKGDYKCFFYRYTGSSIKMLPEAISAITTVEDLEFNALVDESRSGLGNYVLPVNELWLPESIGDTGRIYTIPTVTTIQNTLARAVSQVIVHIRKVNSGGEEIPVSSSSTGTPVNLGELTLDISGVSTLWDITGTSGNAKTFFQTDQAIPNEDGSISYYGPFVFPSEVNATSVNVIFETIDSQTLPSISERTIAGPLERNKKLEITLTVKEGNQVDGVLDVEVEVIEMEDNADGGDNGIWE